MKKIRDLWLVSFLFTSLASFLHAGLKDKTLDVYWVDSEGGGSTLIVTPNDESVLIDAGHLGTRDAAWLAKAIRSAGLTRVDYLVLTHYHSDHFGGASELAKQIPIGTIYQRAIPDRDPDGKVASTFLQEIKAWKDISAKRAALAPGVSIPLRPAAGVAAPKLELKCIASDQATIAPNSAPAKQQNPLAGTGTPKAITPSDDDNSAVLVLEYGAFRFFDGGDLTWNMEEKLISPINLVGKIDVYQTNHHGLDSSNNPLFVQSLAPEVVVMNNGPRKGGQPGSFAALRSVKSIKAQYQVHKSMNVPADQNAADEFIANLEEARPADNCTANFIKMAVAPDGRNYTISIPANGHSRTYQTAAK
jgi:competence protein ComEC